jgi:glycosyltransferase involved in cell wall biosynthesis
MKIAIVTDAWLPQTNGVVTTLSRTRECIERAGHDVLLVTPDGFRSFPCPTYPEIRLAWRPAREIARRLDRFAPQCIHVATEGTLGLAARAYCRRRGLEFTTSYHTQFPRYVRMRAPVPESWSYAYLRWFHGAAMRTMTGTPSQRDELLRHGFRNLAIWPRGVDTALFRPREKSFGGFTRPVAMYVGRVAVEKNIEAFVTLEFAGSKVVVGGGPALESLRRRCPDIHFTGYKFGEELACHIAAADVFVFPSRTDTFGLVMLEAMACGVPVAAYPVTGPVDVVENGVTGILDENLGRAARAALGLDPAACRAQALRHTWAAATSRFLDSLWPIGAAASSPVSHKFQQSTTNT